MVESKVSNPVAALQLQILRSKDPRIRFGTGYPRSTASLLANSLFIDRIPRSLRYVESKLQDNYGISVRINSVEIDNETPFFPVGLHYLPDITLDINPLPPTKQLAGLLMNYKYMKPMIAHEYGHFISGFLPDGRFKYDADSMAGFKSMQEAELSFLRMRGSLQYRYLSGVDFDLFTLPMLETFPYVNMALKELIADKVSEILVSHQAVKDYNSSMSLTYPIQLSWPIAKMQAIHHLAIADIYSLQESANQFADMVENMGLSFEPYMSLDELRTSLRSFYDNIQILPQ